MSAKGLTTGLLSGLKSGHAKCNLHSGYNSGLSNGTANNDKIQDPALLTGEKLPWMYVNADYSLDMGSSTIIIDPLNLPDKWLAYKGIATSNHPDYAASALFLDGNTFVRTGQAWNAGAAWVSVGTSISTTARAYPRVGGQNLGDHVYLDMGGSTGALVAHWLSPISSNGTADFCYLNQAATDSFTVIMVMKSKNIAGKYHFAFEGPTLPGGYELTQLSSTSLQSTLYGNQAGNIKESNYNTISDLTDLQDWCLITVKCTVKQKNGPGSEQEMYVNGKYQHIFSSTTWTTPEVTTTFPASQELSIGSSTISAPVNNSMYLASFLLLPYFANESEQLRLENYFRKYYSKQF